MSLDFIEELASKRRILLDGLDANGGDINLDIFEDFYPDQAHFVFELLQNAEDAGATEAVFRLTQEGCLFEHDGKRVFTEADVRAITGIHNSTKSKTAEQIGKFGVGFKSVFVYTLTPVIWSGDFAFKISRLILPEHVEHDSNVGMKTRFWLPFNNPDKEPKDAYAEVESGLNELAETTLLFLSHLESIRWQSVTGESGEVLRFKHSDNHFEVLKQIGGKTSTSSHFLKFDQSVAVVGLEKQRVAVAYALDFLPNLQNFDPKKTLAKQLKIIPAKPGRVAVFFPAEKETSGLRFHLHAPFVPELSRASIKETDANLPLFQQLATLTAASLHHIRDLGLLTADFLSVLPNPQDSIPDRYQDIRNAVVEEMNEQPLTPTNAKAHAPAKYLHQAKASLKELLSNDDIAFLVDYDDEPPQWASARALQGTDIERFMTGLAITDWDIEQLVDLLNEKASVGGRSISYSPYYTNEPDAEFMTWLSERPMEWHQEMYALLYTDYLSSAGWQKDSRINNLKKLRIIRLSNNEYSVGSKCFFPSDGVEQDDILPRVDARIYTSGKKKGQQESAKNFLVETGVREVGEAEQVEAILEQRYTEADFKPLKKDLKRFIALLEKEPDKASLFTSYFIFERQDGKWGKPSQIFLDQPFTETGLSAYYDALGKNANCVALAGSYQECGVAIKKLVKFAETVGAQTRLEITKSTCYSNPQWSYLHSVGGERETSPINRDYVITKIDKLLAQPTLAISKLMWQTMCSLPTHPDYLTATYRRNQSSGCHYAASQLVHYLRTATWIPQENGVFVRPAEATRELLPEGFPFDPGWQWLKAIQFGEGAVKKSQVYQQKQSNAQSIGFESADQAAKWAEVAKLGLSPDDLLAKHTKKDFPDRVSSNSERRSDKVSDIARNTPEKIKATKNRTVDPEYDEAQGEAKEYLESLYMDKDKEMFCQLCQAPQPVVLDGKPYFEAVDCVAGINTHHKENKLALCPNHAAMYKNGRLKPEEVQRLISECNNQKISLDLAGNTVELRFNSQHLRDLRDVLAARNR